MARVTPFPHLPRRTKLQRPLDKSMLGRKLPELDFLEAVPDAIRQGKHRPAQLYRLRPDKRLVIFDRAM